MTRKKPAPLADSALVTAAKAIGTAAGKLEVAVGMPIVAPEPELVKKATKKVAKKAKTALARVPKKAAKKAAKRD